jgi:cell division protein FtsW
MLFIFGEDYRRARMLNFLNPWKDPAGDGYQLIQSFYALGAGGVTGLGLGQSRQKLCICQNLIMILYFLL